MRAVAEISQTAVAFAANKSAERLRDVAVVEEQLGNSAATLARRADFWSRVYFPERASRVILFLRAGAANILSIFFSAAHIRVILRERRERVIFAAISTRFHLN